MESAKSGNKFTFNFDRNDQILEVEVPEKVDINAVLGYYKIIETSDNFPRNLKVLLNALETDFEFRAYEVPLLAEAAKSAMVCYSRIREAIVVSRPIETAVATVFSETEIENFEFRVFVTLDAARTWLTE